MVSLEQKIKEYVSSVEIPDRVKPEEIRRLLEDNGDMTAGVFLRKLKELKISGSDFLELLGNSKIGNMEFRRIEENPHLKFDELLQILDNSVLSGEDYRMIIAVATQRKELAEQRKRREEETLRRMTEELTAKKNVHKEKETGTNQKDTAAISENTPEANTQEALDSEKISAAEALILRMQKEIDSEENVETVENSSNYTDSNTDTPESEQKNVEETPAAEVEAAEEDNTEKESIATQEESTPTDNSDRDSKSVTMEFCIPAPPVAEANPAGEEAEDFDGIISDDEKIGSNAREIGSAIGELMDSNADYDVSDDKEDCVVIKRRKGCLITSFIGAAILVAGGITLNQLRACKIIPDLTYDIPEKVEQNIDSYETLLNEAAAARDKISYQLPDTFVTVEKKPVALPKNVYGDNLVATVKDTEICGAKEKDGKLSDNFSFETGLTDAGIVKCGEYFAVVGSKDNATVIRTYDESGMLSGKATDEYILSGELVDLYTNGNKVCAVTKDSFDIDKAESEKPETFVPAYTHKGTTQTVEFENMLVPSYVSGLNYYTATMIAPAGDNEFMTKSVIVGDIGGCSVNSDGMYATDTSRINNNYSTQIAYVMFDDLMSSMITGVSDVALNPGLVIAMDDNFAAFGEIYTGDERHNVIITTSKTLGNINFCAGIADGQRIASISGIGKTVTVTSYGDEPMQYSVNADNGEQAENTENTNSVKLNDNVTAQVTVKADKDGNRQGILLAVGGDKKAEVTITAESNTSGDWNSYLTSPVCDDISQLAYYEKDGKITIGIPVMYFDGISQVSVCKFYSYADGKLSELGNITLYDEKYTTLYCDIIGGDKPYILTMWDNRVITASIDKIKVISDTVFKTVEKKDTATDSKTESKTESKTDSKPESNTESKTDSKPESTADSKSE
ncbi:Beta propeller domain [[Eubacterium] siraeum V10Sc8a]|uniref:Beta propeller domain n=1 Tax=[Eubacterium] siraeum V10Sc8a TaxID=717961 RepID=D4MI48_9FIRM|nr:Beta propeller domain [[Eubacterium] siraeum V10Sc8a]